MGAEWYLQSAWSLYQNLITWMKSTVILQVYGVNVTFFGLLLTCIAFKLILALIHALLPGFIGDDDDGGEAYERGLISYNPYNRRDD